MLNKLAEVLVDWIIPILAMIGLGAIIFAIVTMSGCASTPTVIPAPMNNSTTIIWKVIQSTDWLASLFLVGFVCSLIAAGLGFGKLGIVAAASCIAGLFLKAAMSNTWFYWGAGLVVLGAILLSIAGIIMNRQAIKQLVLGAQQVKKDLAVGNNIALSQVEKNDVNSILQANQSKTTRQLVEAVKSNLKIKGKI